MLVNWLLQACWDTHTLAIPLFAHEHGFSASETSTVLASFAVAATLMRALLPFLSAHVNERLMLSGAMIGTTGSLAVLPLLGDAMWMAIVSGVLGFVLGSVQPMTMSMLHQITPPGRHGEVLGLRLTLLNASSAMLPIVLGSLGSMIGVGASFWIMSALAGFGIRSSLALPVKASGS
jgi:predicted MFS family arabinose efflux permease